MKAHTLIHLTALLIAGPTGLFAAEVQKGEMYGYLLYSGERVPDEFNAGFSFYAAAWPLVETYPISSSPS